MTTMATGSLAGRPHLLAEELAGSTGKGFARGTERLCPPAETFERVRPYFAAVGITRIANVTGLDRIGIPVYMVVRPNSRALAVSQGKGADAMAAKVSGVMESIESHHAEYAMLPALVESADTLTGQIPMVDPTALPMTRGFFSEQAMIPWVEGFDLTSGGPRWVPYEAIHANLTAPAVPGSGWFTRTSNGLASGNSRVEATLHALCELIERDAEARWTARKAEALHDTRIDLDTVDDDLCRGLIEQCEKAGVSVMAWVMPTTIGLPCFRVVVFDRHADPEMYPVPAAGGSGCHPNRWIAFSRALTEAVQGRLTLIAGSRDDMARSVYAQIQSPKVLAYHQRRLQEVGSIDARAVPDVGAETLEADVRGIVARLDAAGFHQTVVVDLSRPEWPINVVKAVVPGLAQDFRTLRNPSASP